jgi:hypothetical protein
VGLFLLRSDSITLFCERWLLALLVLSPMVHAWYFTWLIPFAVATRNAGSIAVSLSAFAYFGISALPGGPVSGWPAVYVQLGLIWLPFVCGFAWSEYRRITANGAVNSADFAFIDAMSLRIDGSSAPSSGPSPRLESLLVRTSPGIQTPGHVSHRL